MTPTKEEAIKLLNDYAVLMAAAQTKEQVLEILKAAGKTVGYKPAFRALVIGKAPADSIKWE